MELSVFALRLGLAVLLGGIIGFEREMHGRSAGLRTHMLVSLGSALFMSVSFLMSMKYSHLGTVDPSRIAAGVVTGVGFLGGGAILRSQSSVKGLTTAGSIWSVSAVGMAAGAGLYGASIITALFIVVILFLSRFTEKLHVKSIKNKSGG